MPERNIVDEAAQNVLGRLRGFRDMAEKANPIEAGEERLPSRDAKARLEKMLPEEMKRTIQKIGMDKVLSIMRGGERAANKQRNGFGRMGG